MENLNFVAEISANHNQSLERALAIVDALADSGATSIKLQTYRPDTMTLDLDKPEFKVPQSNALWGGRKLFDLYSEAQTPWEWHAEIFERARSYKMIPFSSPFDRTAVDFLESLGCEIYKIASFELVDLELIRYAASTGKPLIISTGMGSLLEIANAVEAARDAGANDITLLKTTSAYPSSPSESNLITLKYLRESFGVKVGVSDHTLGIGAAIAAVTLGATVVEKHVTLSRKDGGVDSAFSMEPSEFQQLVREAKTARESVGEVHFGPTATDSQSTIFRRSLIFSKDVSVGEIADTENVSALRPGIGLPIRFYRAIEGLELKKSANAGDPVTWEHFKS